MPAILGIDAAWGPKAPSGVALVASSPRQGARGGWRCVALAPSIGAFLDLAEGRRIDWRRGVFQGGAVEARELLEAARALGAGEVVCAGVDMPLAHGPITGRRPTWHPCYAVSMRKRKRVEEIFGWLKTVGVMRKTRHKGSELVGWMFTFSLAAHNLARMRHLVPAG